MIMVYAITIKHFDNFFEEHHKEGWFLSSSSKRMGIMVDGKKF